MVLNGTGGQSVGVCLGTVMWYWWSVCWCLSWYCDVVLEVSLLVSVLGCDVVLNGTGGKSVGVCLGL